MLCLCLWSTKVLFLRIYLQFINGYVTEHCWKVMLRWSWDHEWMLSILLNCLKNNFGIGGTALQWIESYLTNCTQRVVIGDTSTIGAKSESMSLKFGVPQGSVLSPILFTLYTCPLDQICAKHIYYHLYADDQQIYLSFKPGSTRMQSPQDDFILQMEWCIEEIRNWMTINMLKLNDDKMEFIIFGTC